MVRYRLVLFGLLMGVGVLLGGWRWMSAPKVYRVGLLAGMDAYPQVMEAFRAEMGALGYEEGTRVVYELRTASGDKAKMKQVAEAFVADGVDLIVTTSNGGALAAKAATAESDIPVVFTLASNLLHSGVVDDLCEPGGNMTGVLSQTEHYVGKELELVREMAPHVQRVWLPYDAQEPTTSDLLASLHEVAPLLGVELVVSAFETPEAILADLAAREAAKEIGFDAILMMPAPLIHMESSWKGILGFATEHNLPIAAFSATHVREGALLSYSPNDAEFGQRAAFLASKVLDGRSPATIPVISTEPQLVINYQTAQTFGLSIRESLLLQAVEVID